MEILLDILNPINIVFLLVILYLTIEDFRSFQSKSYRNYKTIIVSVGILGTFTGIFWGLLGFDSHDLVSIQKSIPALLTGLRTAFVTSIFGMMAALTLTFAQKKFFDASYSEDSSEILRSMEIKLSKLDKLNDIYDINIDFLREVNSLKDDIQETNREMVDNLSINFERTNEALESAMTQFSQNSSKEIVGALEGIIEKFNENMIDQFGNNFKEFNEAVGKLLAWQMEYKDFIENMSDSLNKTVESVQKTEVSLASISDKNEEIVRVYEMFGEMIAKYEEQSATINTKILSQIELLEIIQGVFEDTKVKFGEFVHEFSDGSHQVMAGFGETKESLDNISDKINISLGQQSEALNQLSKKLENDLPKSLLLLDKTLKSLTEGFKNDYKSFLDYYKQLVLTQE